MASNYEFMLPVRPDQLQAIGMVACEWSYLESIIEAAIWNLAYMVDEETGMAITTHLGMPQRLDMLLTLFHKRFGEGPDYDALRKHCGHIRHQLSAKRGGIIHRRWVEGDQASPMQFIVSARGKLEHSKEGRPVSHIRRIASEIAEQSAQLRALFGGLVPESPWLP
jgi:hypothetical protein